MSVLLIFPAMNKTSTIKITATICLVISALGIRAQDTAQTRPVQHTAPKTGVINPRLQKPYSGQRPVNSQPNTISPVMHHAPGAVRPATGTTVKQPAAGTNTTAPSSAAQQHPAATAIPEPVFDATDKSLNGQYQYLLTRVYAYQRPMVSAFYKNVTDSLARQKAKVAQLSTSLTAQGKTLKDMQTDMNNKEQSLNESTSKVDSIDLLGISMSKSSYNILMWGLVALFGAVAAFVIIQSGGNRREAKYRTKLYDDLDNEYKTYKTKSNEKEKRLARELQTVRNKLEEITGNPEY